MKVSMTTIPTNNGYITRVGETLIYAVKRVYVDGEFKTVAIVNPSLHPRNLFYIIFAAEQKAAANRARAQKLLSKVEKHGITFDSDEDRTNELTRLAGLSDDAFSATEDAFDRMIKADAEKAIEEELNE